MRSLSRAVAVIVLAAGCVYDPGLPAGRVTCADDDPCPGGFVCTRTGSAASGPQVCCRTPGCEGEGVEPTGAPQGPDATAEAPVRTDGPQPQAMTGGAGGAEAGAAPDVAVDAPAIGPDAATTPDAQVCPMGGTPPECDPCNGACTALANVVAATCGAGAQCQIERCRAGFSDCDKRGDNGCEADLSKLETCGTCETNCRVTLPSAQRPVCSAGKCAEDTCPAGFAHCTTKATDVCETNIRTAERCGSCSNNCASLARVAATSCVNGTTCQVDRCNAGWDNCDKKSDNGCETDLGRPATCGACGTNCMTTLPHVAATRCMTGKCEVDQCASGWGDCTSAAGCETETSNNLKHCGGCGRDCARTVLGAKTVKCAGGKCGYDECLENRRDYDENPENGCETITPLGVPEVENLALWYSGGVGYTGSAWMDRSGKGHNASCTTCPTVMTNTLAGETTAVFSGNAQSMSIGGSAFRFMGPTSNTGSLTVLALYRANAASVDDAPIVELAEAAAAGEAPASRITIRKSATIDDHLSFEVCNRSHCNSTRSKVWKTGSWTRVALVARTSGKLTVIANDVTQPEGTINPPVPDHVDLGNNRLGASAASNSTFNGNIAEIVVFDKEISDASVSAILGYFKRKYDL